MSEENNIEKVEDFQKGYLTLPFNDDQFKDFIRGLLGTPQTITKRIKGNFELHLKDLQNFHDLIDQRVTQQNNGKLIQLKTQVYYSDNSSVILSSYEELISYNEIKPVVSIAARMTWTYLIQFADKTVPEKQEIELMIVSSPTRNLIEDDDIPVFYITDGEFQIAIKHTARTWGSDIETLLVNQINSILTPCSKVRKILRKRSGAIGTLAGAMVLMGALISIFIATRNFNIKEVEKVADFSLKNPDITSKTNYLLTYLAENTQNIFFLKSLLYTLVSIIISIIIGIWVGSLADNSPKSYLVLTREAKKNRDKMIEIEKRQTAWFWVSIVISIVTGIVSNYIFSFLTQ